MGVAGERESPALFLTGGLFKAKDGGTWAVSTEKQHIMLTLSAVAAKVWYRWHFNLLLIFELINTSLFQIQILWGLLKEQDPAD